MESNIRFSVIFAVVVFLCAVLGAGALPAEEGTSKLEIPFEKYSLENGLEVILHQDHSLPIVSVSVWYHVAAFHETAGRSGFAHLFEHMMFQGSGHIEDDAHFKILESIGASIINGTTSFDRTNYFETVPSNHLETALWLESDRMGFLLDAMTQEKLDNQRSVVKNERRQTTENRPYGLGEEKLWQSVFPKSHPYHGNVIGSMDDLTAASLEDVSAFFTKWYAPANATLALAGDFKTDEVKALVEKYFGSLPKSTKPESPVVAPVALDKEIVIEHAETVANLAKVKMMWLTPAIFAEGDAAADILASILAEGKSSRLHKRLVRELELAQSVYAYQYSLGAQSVFVIDAVCRDGVEPKRLREEIDLVLADIRQGKFGDNEIVRAANQFETGFFNGLQYLGGFGGKADKLQAYNHFFGDPNFLSQDLARYRKVTREDIVQLANKNITSTKRAVLLAVPAKQPTALAKKEAN